MKNLIFCSLCLAVLTIFFFSCNKDTTTTPTGGNSNTGPVTSTFNSNPGLNKFITNAQPVFDTINANITDNINANNISDVKITLGDVSSVEVNKIKFSILHNGTEVGVIDSLTKSGVGNFSNTVLWDSSGTPIDQGVTPYTGTFKPQHLLSSFVNKDPAGQWIIKIIYSGALKTGVIKSWGITVTYQAQPVTNIFPLALGNYWIYIDSSSPGNITSDTQFVLGTYVVHGKQVYGLNANPTTIFVRNESDGFWLYGYLWDTISPLMQPHLIFKYPVNNNETYLAAFDSLGYDTIKCINNNATYNGYTGCIEYYRASYNNNDKSYHYFKPGIGSIGQIRFNNGLFNRLTRLVQYHLN